MTILRSTFRHKNLSLSNVPLKKLIYLKISFSEKLGLLKLLLQNRLKLINNDTSNVG